MEADLMLEVQCYKTTVEKKLPKYKCVAVVVHTPAIPAVGRRREKDQEFKVIFYNIGSWRPAWAA